MSALKVLLPMFSSFRIYMCYLNSFLHDVSVGSKILNKLGNISSNKTSKIIDRNREMSLVLKQKKTTNCFEQCGELCYINLWTKWEKATKVMNA